MTGVETPFCSMMRATGLAEVWTHTHDKQKFKEYGWRSTTKDVYQNKTLIGNWNEDRFDVQALRKSTMLPSCYAHYYDTTYDKSYRRAPHYKVPEQLRRLEGRQPRAYPSHQPELDPQVLKDEYNSWATTHRTSFIHPKLRTMSKPFNLHHQPRSP